MQSNIRKSSMSRKKVGVITMHRVINIGSALQAYATQQAVESLGYDCQIIDYLYPTEYHMQCSTEADDGSESIFREFRKNFLSASKLLQLSRWMKQFLLNHKYVQNRNRQKKKFQEWQKLLHRTQPYSRSAILRRPPLFDIYMTGSDQTWKARNLGKDYSFLLDFAPIHAPRIAYAASFGASRLPDKYRQVYATYLKQYRQFSVRELSGSSLTEELTGRVAPLVLDPIFLLNRKQWQEVADKSVIVQKPYILCYLLVGVFNPYPYAFTLIDKIRELTGYQVVFIGFHGAAGAKGYQVLPDVGPAEFLQLYEQAALVVTNSFHGTAFALNYRKLFFTLCNPGQTSDDRVSSLLNLFEVQSRGILPAEINHITARSLSFDWQRPEEILGKYRALSLDYLKQVLQTASPQEFQ